MLNVKILDAGMSYTEEDGYVGKVQFEVEGDSGGYEITLQSKRGKDWGYGLFFLKDSGDEEKLLALEERLEEDDELFDYLVETAKAELPERKD
ncbi:hypothetical protein ACFSL6_09655 [Paenibacillus thailandensis]|uniref:DUF1292 domain-containing protein n=1 Tax=Paenibacillus thailandensis TaxID=393250 RepID=A0ABW5R1V3_9BACL